MLGLKLNHVSKRGHIYFNTLRPIQNGLYFANDIYKCIFENENQLPSDPQTPHSPKVLPIYRSIIHFTWKSSDPSSCGFVKVFHHRFLYKKKCVSHCIKLPTVPHAENEIGISVQMVCETFSALLAFVRGIHRSLANFPHKGQWRGALMFSLICTWLNGWVNNRERSDLRRHRAYYDVIVIIQSGQ